MQIATFQLIAAGNGYWTAAGHCEKGIGKLLGNAPGYWKASGQFLKGIEKLLGNANIPAVGH